MSSLMIAHDSHIMMLEVSIDKLFVPNSTRFDDVVLSKSIVSIRFLDDEWVDIMPNRLDYRKYKGSAGAEQRFYGGKSVVFAVSSALLAEEECGEESWDGSSQSTTVSKCLEMSVRREISTYFAIDRHVCDFGRVWINVCELFCGIVEELKIRRDLHGYLSLAHERDPISRSTKGHYNLENPETCDPTNCHLDIYVRLSYLGGSVITEIDRPLLDDPSSPFYAQEETNLASPYECLELDADCVKPICKVPILTKTRCHELECACTDEQRYRLMLTENMKHAATYPMPVVDEEPVKDKPTKKKKKKDQSTGTGADTDNKSCATDVVCSGQDGDGTYEPIKRKARSKLTAEDLAALLAANRRGASISVGIIDKAKPCEPCVPCVPCIIESPCVDVCPRPICPTTYPCPPPPLYCCD